MDQNLLRVVTADNEWLEGKPLGPWYARRLPPSYLPRSLTLAPADERVTLVIGPRQSGKSTLIWHTLSATGKPCLYLNCEDPAIRSWLVSPGAFLADLDELVPPETPLFFEEVQALEEAGLFLKGLVDRHTGRALYATGSSSYHLEAETRESLAGRALRYLLLPYSLAEVAGSLGGAPALRQHHLQESLPRLQVFGSYPRVYSAAEPARELAGLVSSFIVRDVSDRFEIRRPDAFRRVLELAASQIGNLCNFSEWAALSSVSADTVAEYCRLLEETHVLRLLRPFVGGKRAEITSTPKAFFLDNGIRNQLFGGFGELSERGDRGALFENFVFTEIAKHSDPLLESIHFWRSKSGAEVDFVLRRNDALIAIEAKAGDTRGQISRSARSFLEAYAPTRLLVVHTGAASETVLGTTTVRFLGLADLASALSP